MDRNEEYNFTVINDDGKEVICDVISLLQDTNSNKLYVIYTDYSMNNKNQFNTYLSELAEIKKGDYRLKNVDNKETCKRLISNAKTVYGKVITDLVDNNEKI